MAKAKTPQKLLLSDETTFALIQEFELQPCLWHKSHKDYKCQLKKNEALEAISAKLHIKPEMVKDKIKSLKTIYFQNTQKLKKMKAGSQPRWKFFSALNFLQLEATESGHFESLFSQSSTLIKMQNAESAEEIIMPPKRERMSYDEDDRYAGWSEVADPIQSHNANQAFAQYVSGTLDQIKDQTLIENVKCKIRLLLSSAVTLDAKAQLEALPNSILSDSSQCICGLFLANYSQKLAS